MVPFLKFFLGPKMPRRGTFFKALHYALVFTYLLHKPKLLFCRKTLHKSRKNFEKMDKKNVQKSICQNLFAQKRAALGNLRNFLGCARATPYMQRHF
jgi:hypothetical protein